MCVADAGSYKTVAFLTCPQLAFQFVVMWDCAFIQFGQDNYASLGLWCYGVAGTCDTEEYVLDDEWYTGSWITSARSCLIISMICGAAATTMVTFEWICCEVCCAGILEGLAFAGAWIFGS